MTTGCSPREIVAEALVAYWHQELGAPPARSFRPDADAVLEALIERAEEPK